MYRLPIVDEKAPTEHDFDALLDKLRQTGNETACIFNCQVHYILYLQYFYIIFFLN
jgi:hypothetical protein